LESNFFDGTQYAKRGIIFSTTGIEHLIIRVKLDSIKFVDFRSKMFLTNPTIEELIALDLTVLLDMLAYQTSIHIKLAKSDGVSGTVHSSEQLLINIQSAIEAKMQMEKNAARKSQEMSVTQGTSSPNSSST
jgi:hypothetical protein